MSLPGVELAAQIAVERVLNSLPEGLLLAAGAWLLLRVMGRQNAGTRFAVWMVTLVGITVLPWLDGLGTTQAAAGTRGDTGLTIPGIWALAFFFLWAAAACGLLARIAAGIWHVRSIRRSCVEVPLDELPPVLQELIRRSRRGVRILASTEARVPAAIGLGPAAIVLPAWALDELSTESLRAILIHELTHLERCDDWTNLLQKGVRAVLFFHPAVWWIESRLSMEREMACDDAVLAATGNPRAYAGCLIGLLERSCARRGWTVAQAAVARARDAAQRIAQILSPGRSASVRMGRLAPAIAAGLSAGCIGVALCAPQFVVVEPDQPVVAAAKAPALLSPVAETKPMPPKAAPARVVPAAFRVKRPATVHRHRATKPLYAAAAVPAVVRSARKDGPRVELASQQDRGLAGAPAPQWTAVETAIYSRSVAAGIAAGQPVVVQTITWQTVRWSGKGTIRTWETLRVVWMTPAQVLAEEAAASRSI